MSEELKEIKPGFYAGLSQSIGAVVTIRTPKKRTPTKTVEEEIDNYVDDWHYWGTNNNFPQEVIADCEKNNDLGPSLSWKGDALYGRGLSYQLPGEQKNREMETYRKRAPLHLLLRAKDLVKFYNSFVELTLNASRRKIIYVQTLPAQTVRFGRPDSKRGNRPKYVYVSSDWPSPITDPERIKVLDPLLDTPETIRADNAYKYVMPLAVPTGKSTYQLADWNTIRQTKWLELADLIPKFKVAIMKNQVTIKYHIQIPNYYWTDKFPQWNSLEASEQKKLVQEEWNIINAWLKGVDNAGRSFFTGFRYDEELGKEFPGIKVEAIKDKYEEGTYLEDTTESRMQIYSALNVDPSLFGLTPGTAGSNKSGSDKREAYNLFQETLKPLRDILLLPENLFISEYNGWPDAEWQIGWPTLQTLDNVTPQDRSPNDRNDNQ